MILVSGSLAYDYLMNFPGYFRDHLLPEKLHTLSVSFFIPKMERNFGGTAGNIAYNLALLGERSTILASAGNDFKKYGQWLRAKGVALSAVQVVKTLPTAGAYIMTDRADNQITGFYPGAMGEKCKIKNIKLKMNRVRMGIVAPGNLEDMRALVKMYKKYKVPYIFDPGQVITALSAQDLRAGIDGAKVFISNDYELAMALKKTGWAEREIVERVGMLVVTLGEKGSVIKVRNPSHPPLTLRGGEKTITPLKVRGAGGVMRINIPPAKPKNTCDPTGAGDAYRAGFIKGLLMGLSYDKVGKLAATVAAYTVEQYGTQTHAFSWQGLLKRYKENYKESLL